jgi:uncharacterized membrane protein YeaQ/YmgE (transglycosylase-associated protein family)
MGKAMLRYLIGLISGSGTGFILGVAIGWAVTPTAPKDRQWTLFFGILLGLAGACFGTVAGWVWNGRTPIRDDEASMKADYRDPPEGG